MYNWILIWPWLPLPTALVRFEETGGFHSLLNSSYSFIFSEKYRKCYSRSLNVKSIYRCSITWNILKSSVNTFFYTATEIGINTNALTRFCLSSSILILAAGSRGWIRTDFSSATVFSNIFIGPKIYTLFSCNCSQSELWTFCTSCFTVSQYLSTKCISCSWWDLYPTTLPVFISWKIVFLYYVSL